MSDRPKESPIASLIMDGFGDATDEELAEMAATGHVYRPYTPLQVSKLHPHGLGPIHAEPGPPGPPGSIFCFKGVPGCKCAVGFKPEEQCPDCRENELRDSCCVCPPKDLP